MTLENKCQVGGQIYSHHPTTTAELCSKPLTGKGSVITISMKLGYVKAFTPCVPLIMTLGHHKKGNENNCGWSLVALQCEVRITHHSSP
jgi:hypothetical protein